MSGHAITRAQFLARTAALAVAASALPAGDLAAAARPAAATAGAGPTHRGVAYSVADGATRATSWDAVRMRADLTAIQERLHADSVSIYGDGVPRLAATAAEAAARGLHVWLQPRLGDVPQAQILEHLGDAGREADALRLHGADIALSIGAEFFLFVPGVVPGADAVERVHNLLSGRFDGRRMQRRLDAFIAEAAGVGRAAFGGTLSYAASQDDVVDWRLFDVVSIDYYSTHGQRSRDVRDLRRFARWGKPVWIAEYGACTYEGAARRGGLAWDVFDVGPDGRERIRGGLVRSEYEQAAYLVRQFDLFSALGLRGATVYEFVTPDAPHRRDPRHDLDMASYAIVKPLWGARDRATPGWHWEPKAAFRALAARYARAAAGGAPSTQ